MSGKLNFGRAAAQLRLSQSALSRQVSSLERLASHPADDPLVCPLNTDLTWAGPLTGRIRR